MRNTKAISPIFATLILIAIAIIAGVVVYAFTSGFLSSSTGGAPAANEKMSIQAVQVTSGTALDVFAQSQSGNINIADKCIIKDSGGNVVDANAAIDNTAPVTNALTDLLVTPSGTGLTSGSYTVTVITALGNQFVSPSFTVP